MLTGILLFGLGAALLTQVVEPARRRLAVASVGVA
jgi:hypothetical protein